MSFCRQLAFGKIARCSGAKRVADEAVAAPAVFADAHAFADAVFTGNFRATENEKPFVLIPVGLPAKDARVPDISRKPLDEIMTVH